MDITVTYKYDRNMGGMAWVTTRDGVDVGSASSEAGAEEATDMIRLFGYFDPTESRQRDAMRARKAAMAAARDAWLAGAIASR